MPKLLLTMALEEIPNLDELDVEQADALYDDDLDDDFDIAVPRAMLTIPIPVGSDSPVPAPDYPKLVRALRTSIAQYHRTKDSNPEEN